MRLILDGRAIGALLVGALAYACGGPTAAPAQHTEAGAQEAGTQEAEAPGDSAGTAQGCPMVGPIAVSPTETVVGSEVDVSVPLAIGSAIGVTFTWTATDGQFESSNVRETRFACTSLGEVTIDLQVFGGVSADGGSCLELRSATVQCDALPLQDGGFPQDGGVRTGPCTLYGQPNCVPCTGSPGGLCSPTEGAFVTHDPTGACYACLLGAGCIDGAADGPTGNECDDLTGDTVTGPSAGDWKPSICREALSCILSTGCANPSVVSCYCGLADGAACALPGAATGACLAAENAGLETSDPQTALGPSFTSKALAAGVANAIFVCAAANHCDSCLGGVSDAGTDAESTEASSSVDP